MMKFGLYSCMPFSMNMYTHKHTFDLKCGFLLTIVMAIFPGHYVEIEVNLFFLLW